MRCPKCQFDHELQTTECLKCGIVFAHYQAALERATNPAVPAAPIPLSPSTSPAGRNDAVQEFICRALALPLTLIVARLIAGTGLRMVAAMLAMVLHESGHALTAWLTGRWAVPLLWVTPHGEERSWWTVLALTTAICLGGFYAWKAQRWGWLSVAAAALILQLIVLSLPSPGAMIVFWGDGGAMALATLLMAAFYAPRECALVKNWGLRWGLLAIGALSFMHVFLVWTGPWEDIPFGEIEGVNLSDPSLLTEMYGWRVTRLVDRYVQLGKVCLVVLLALYIWGLVSAYLAIPSSAKQRIWRFGRFAG